MLRVRFGMSAHLSCLLSRRPEFYTGAMLAVNGRTIWFRTGTAILVNPIQCLPCLFNISRVTGNRLYTLVNAVSSSPSSDGSGCVVMRVSISTYNSHACVSVGSFEIQFCIKEFYIAICRLSNPARCSIDLRLVFFPKKLIAFNPIRYLMS